MKVQKTDLQTVEKRYRLVINAFQKLFTIFDIDQLLKEIQKLIIQELKPSNCLIILKRDDKTNYEIISMEKKEELNFSKSIVKEVIENSKSCLLYKDSDQPKSLSKSAIALGIRSIICVPLISSSRSEAIGALYVDNRNIKELYMENDLIFAEYLAYISAMAIENAFLYNKTIKDDLTDVYSRHFLMLKLQEELERVKRFDIPLSFMLLDIDDFKQINDTYGHPMGDKVLQETARYLKSNVRSYDIVSRYGGDEFAILFPEVNANDALAIAQKISAGIKNATKNLFELPSATASIGIACYPFHYAQYPEELIQKADLALYKAKRAGKNAYHLYEQETLSNVSSYINEKNMNLNQKDSSRHKNIEYALPEEALASSIMQLLRILKDSNNKLSFSSIHIDENLNIIHKINPKTIDEIIVLIKDVQQEKNEIDDRFISLLQKLMKLCE